MTSQNNAAQAAVQDLEYVVQQLRQAGRVVDEEGELTDRLDALLSKLRTPVSNTREAFELTYAADADDPACAADLLHFTNGWRACIMSQARAPVADERGLLPCPFCGSEAFETFKTDDDGIRRHSVHCKDPNCGGQTRDRHFSEAKAIAAWNRRAALASAPVAGEAQPVCWIEKDVLESVRDEGSDAWVYWRPADHVAEHDEMPLYAAPQASAGQVQAALQKSFDMGKFYGSLPETDAEDVRNAALEEAAAICDSMDNHANPMTSRDCADAIRALKQPQAAKDARTCSCPSGDGSLRHPCAVHPPAPLVDESPNLQGSQVDGSTEMQGHAGAVVLPPLPKPVEQIGFLGGRPQDLFDLEGLRSYARAAVLADRQQRATQPEQGERDE
ncbi:FIG00434035: hypothetical protein [Achromobacter xylosoxidans NH44784-1996]|uniref:Lar family restriction alleviation protein n=1 Tax=Alcaligenes xylosoxydans xylosoxydans TaxID=85698 RepID=UPI0003321BDF|nr:Lar family restriction alleviation protein [Achromobacter xylosoxidans]CCH04722.1 FIG00434035: hypothetical protein [Achromobacter xylosoxidans NH44784-1996]